MSRVQNFIEGVCESPKISSASKSRIESIYLYPGYSEPGYADPESKLVALGNWNDADERNPDYAEDKRQSPWRKADDYVSRVGEVLEKRYGVELEWEDEWTSCSDCGKLVRTQANSYSWTRAYVELDGDIVCHECIPKHASEVIAEFEGNESKALTPDLGLDPAEHGYVCILRGLENGFHEGQAADPKVVAKALRECGADRFLFKIDATGQFDIKFSCWVAEEQKDKVPMNNCVQCGGTMRIGHSDCWACEGIGKIADFNVDAEVSPATQMKEALQKASIQSAQPGHVVYSSIDGSDAKTTVMSHDQIRRCPNLIMLPSHYNADGSCKCPEAQ